MTDTAPFPSRSFGVLMHPTSFPGPEPIGTLGAEAHGFVDWLATTGASIWQILPLTYLGEEDSPYFSPSSFAGNTWLIDLRELADAGLLNGIGTPPAGDGSSIDFEAMRAWKAPLLDAAATAFLDDREHPWRADYERFLTRAPWVADVCHFIARKHADPDTAWWDWEPAVRRRERAALATSARDHARAIEREQALQFFFDRQWRALHARARAAGIVIMGDTPIYVAPDSVDVWAHQGQFQLDADGRLTAQAGVPPDYFSESGQLWGNPIYRWDSMADDGFSWWLERLGRTLEQTDIVRIDHFRALSAYWSVPAEAETAIGGTWVRGPGQAFVEAVKQTFPGLPIVAEDLGDLDDEVLDLRDRNGFVGMRVLQFGFDGPANEHHPSRIVERCVVYTGTHDNDTLAGWWASSPRRRTDRIRRDTEMPPRLRTPQAVRWLVETALASPAVAAVVPVQDLLALGTEARMNVPGTDTGNWQWRLPGGLLTEQLADDVRALATTTGRC